MVGSNQNMGPGVAPPPPKRSILRRFPWWVWGILFLCVCGSIASLGQKPKTDSNNLTANNPALGAGDFTATALPQKQAEATPPLSQDRVTIFASPGIVQTLAPLVTVYANKAATARMGTALVTTTALVAATNTRAVIATETPRPINKSQLRETVIALEHPETPTPVAAVKPTKPAEPGGSYTASASVSDASPGAGATVRVTGKLLKDGAPVKGSVMNTTWHYKSKETPCSGAKTDANGVAGCSNDTGKPTKGYEVEIDVVFMLDGVQVATAHTAFTPH